MRGKPFAMFGSLFLVLMIIGGFAFVVATQHTTGGANKQTSNIATATPDPYGCNIAVPERPPVGAPAIQPKNNNVIAFSTDDAKNYVSQPSPNKKSIIVDDVQFITSAQACITLQGERTGLAPDAMVCIARSHGENAAAVGGGPFKEIDIFDAHTGNNLVSHVGA